MTDFNIQRKMYKDLSLIIEKYGTEKKGDVFIYDETPYEKICEEFFEFYMKRFSQFEKYGLPKSVIYFSGEFSRNAKASKVISENGSVGVIGINIGLVKAIKEESDLCEKAILDSDKYKGFLKDIDVTPSRLWLMLSMFYTYYHEMGHLIQRPEICEFSMDEYVDFGKGFDFENHILEFDADRFSALCLGEHLVHYVQKENTGFKDNNTIEELLSFVIAVVFTTLLNFQSNQKQLYFRKESHPHPQIRLIIISRTILGYFGKYAKLPEGPLPNLSNIIDNAILLSKKIDFISGGQNNTQIMENELVSNKKEIEEYLIEIEESSKNRLDLAVGIRNKTLKGN